jgi:bifunctional non-homologous end joining protein LigD
VSTIRIGRRRLEISHPDKVLFPDDGITKADLVEYHRRVARFMVPHTKGAPVMLERYPDGIGGHGFIQKEISGTFPAWVPRVEIPKKGGTVVHALADNAATLVYLAAQGCLTVHTFTSRVPQLDRPYRLIFDLDPSADRFEWVRDGARGLRRILDELGLVPFLKTTGSRGLHVVVPLDGRSGFDEVRPFAQDVAAVLARADPERFTTEFHKKERGDRVYLDVARNGYAQTAVAPYSVRARKGAPVATPVDWSELDDPDFGPRRFSLFDVPERLEQNGDPWAGMGRQARSLRRPRRRLGALLPAR